MSVVCFYLAGDRHSLSSMASEAARPADESWEFGDHRVSGARVRMYKRSGLQVREHADLYSDNTRTAHATHIILGSYCFTYKMSNNLLIKETKVWLKAHVALHQSTNCCLLLWCWSRPVFCCRRINTQSLLGGNDTGQTGRLQEKMDDVLDVVLISYIRMPRFISLFCAPLSFC